MSYRGEWKFGMPAGSILSAAMKKRLHHAERVEFWEGEQRKAEQALRADGLQFKEQQVSGGQRLQAVIDPTLEARLTETRCKVATHKAFLEEYAAWERLLETVDSDATYDLNFQDAVYFGI